MTKSSNKIHYRIAKIVKWSSMVTNIMVTIEISRQHNKKGLKVDPLQFSRNLSWKQKPKNEMKNAVTTRAFQCSYRLYKVRK